MAYKDSYVQYLKEAAADIRFCERTGRRVVFGYASNLDIIFQYDPAAFQRLLDEHLCTEPHFDAEDSIDSIADLARILSAYMLLGEGAEIDITDYRVCQYLNEHFQGTPGLGGTCAQGAAALAAVGMPLITHVTDRCREVCELMSYPGLDAVKDGRQVPIREVAAAQTPVYHMVFQFTKGDTFRIGNRVCTVPRSNRLIMDYDTVHKDFGIDPDFQAYLEAHAGQLIAYNISGFNGMIDPAVAKRRLAEMDRHFRVIKERNPDCIFYFESAHYMSPQVKRIVYDTMARYVDILGMNEEELVVHTRECGQDIDKTSFPDILRGLELVHQKHSANGIILHTQDYSMYYGNELKGINIEKGLTIGNLMAGTRAKTGRYGSYRDCEDGLQYPLSRTGLRFFEELAAAQLPVCTCLVPSRYMDKPKCTIGLGDTFVAGVQMAFVR